MFKKIILHIVLIACMFTMYSQTDYENIQVKSSFNGSWTTKPTKLVNLIPDYIPATDGFTDFTRTGCYKYLRTDSTGYYYVKKIDGRWWMIDPDGYAGINMAVNSVSSSNIQNEYDICLRNGYNGIGNWPSSESQTKNGYNLQNYFQFSYVRRLNLLSTYATLRKNYYTTPAEITNSDHIFVLDPQFAVYCENTASTKVAPFNTERHLLGWFTDNELNFNQDQLRNLVKNLLPGDPSRDSALAWASMKGLSETDCINYSSKVTEEIKQEFAGYLADRYFKIVSEAIRKYDQNHLILGSRLHGRPRMIQSVVDASHKYMDVTSVNFYDRYSPEEQISLASWTKDKPCLVTEFYIKDINKSVSSQSGAGWYVNGQENRGKFYQNTCLELLKNKCYIGWHYFRFDDDPDGSNKGMVNSAKIEYTAMTKYMEELNNQVYRICDYYDNIDRRPDVEKITHTIAVSEDTYVIPSSNNSNYGNLNELEVGHSSFPENRREAFLKFNLTDYISLLPDLKNAELEIYCTQSDQSTRSLYATGIMDKSWNENTLNGNLRNSNSDWNSGYDRLSFQKGVISTGILKFDITNWIYNQPDTTVFSFKLIDLTSSNFPIKIASKEYSDSNMHPKLKLVFWDKSTNITNSVEASNYLAYPNPVNTSINIDGPLSYFQILSLSGQILINSYAKTLDISNLSSGIYFVRIFDEGSRVVSNLKFIKH